MKGFLLINLVKCYFLLYKNLTKQTLIPVLLPFSKPILLSRTKTIFPQLASKAQIPKTTVTTILLFQTKMKIISLKNVQIPSYLTYFNPNFSFYIDNNNKAQSQSNLLQNAQKNQRKELNINNFYSANTENTIRLNSPLSIHNSPLSRTSNQKKLHNNLNTNNNNTFRNS